MLCPPDFTVSAGLSLGPIQGVEQRMAVLLTLRRLVDEHGAATAAELMLIDSVVLAYYHQLRINGWIGDLSIWLEREFFGHDKTLTAKFRDYYGVAGATFSIW
jgi:hypothetical protein